MLFSKKLPFFKKKKQKNRSFKYFKIYKNNKKKFNFFKIKCLNFVRLFINHIKMIDFFLRKCTSKFRRLSKKEYYKKLKEENNRVKERFKLFKKILKRSSTKKLYKYETDFKYIKKIYLKKYRRTHNTYLCFNHVKIPYTRKSLNSRMGKGKGSIKNWCLKFYAGKVIFFLKRWKSNSAINALNLLKKYIPGNTILSLPKKSYNKVYSSNSVFFI